MSDPMTTRDTTQPPPPENRPERKSAAWLWILLVIAILALAWYFLAGRGPSDAVPDASDAPPAVEIGGDEAPQEAGGDTTDETAPADDGAAAEDDAATTTPVDQDQPATPIARLQPEYPREAYRDGAEGTVLLRAHVDATGTTTDVEVIERSPSPDLDRAAKEAVGQWRFEPAIKNGEPIASTVEVPITFNQE